MKLRRPGFRLVVAMALVSAAVTLGIRSRYRPTPAPRYLPAMAIAVKHRDAHVIRGLLRAGVPPDSIDGKGNPVLHDLVWGRNLPLATLLLESGAHVNARDKLGNTPLHIAAHTGNARLIELLLRYGADPTARDNAGRVPADPVPAHGRTHSIELTLPPLSLLFLRPLRHDASVGGKAPSANASSSERSRSRLKA